MITAATKASARAYNNSRELFLEISELFMNLEDSTGAEKAKIIKDLKYSLNDLKTEYKKIKMDTLYSNIPDAQAKDVEHNINIFRSNIDKMTKHIMSVEFYDNIAPNINKYILGVIPTLSREEIDKYGDDPIVLKKKFMAKILNPNRIETFKLKLNQLVQSTLSQNMFNSIFKGLLYDKKIEDNVLTNKEYVENFGHPESHKRAKDEYDGFQSLKDYKKQQEEGIPIMITNQMRFDLANLGYSKTEISKLKPEEAHSIINKSADSSTKANVKFRKK